METVKNNIVKLENILSLVENSKTSSLNIALETGE